MNKKPNNLKLFYLSFFLLFKSIYFSQHIHHQMISALGNNFYSNGYSIQYTVGQQSITGTSINNLIVQQGFQQNNRTIKAQLTNNIFTVVFPNPVKDIVNFTFSKSPGTYVDIFLYNSLGKEVIVQTISNVTNYISLYLSKLASEVYLLKISSENYVFSTKILKQ